MSSLWIIECGVRARASDVLRSTRGIRNAFGTDAVIRVEGLLPGEQLLLAGLPGEQSMREPLTLSDVKSSRLATLLPAGAVPVAPEPFGTVHDSAILISSVGAFIQGESLQTERIAGEGNSRFAADLRLLSTQSVVSLGGDVLAALWDTAESGQRRQSPAGGWLRTLIHASGLPVIDAGQIWTSAAETADQGSFPERTPENGYLDLVPSLVTVVVSNAGDDAEQATRMLESIRASDLALCPLVLPGSPGEAQAPVGKTLFTLLLHPDQQVHPKTGQILLGLMGDSPVALVRALVDGSPSPVELWWSRALVLSLQQEEVDVDRFARAYGDERWIAASWAGISLDGTEPRRIPKRFMEQVK